MRIRKSPNKIAALICIICLFVSSITAGVLFADDNSELSGKWDLLGVYMNDEFTLGSKYGLEGTALFVSSLFSIDIDDVDIHLSGNVTKKDDVYILNDSDGGAAVAAAAVKDGTLIVFFGEELSIAFIKTSSSSSSGLFGSSSNGFGMTGSSNSYSNSYESGTYIIGEDMPAGEYVFFASGSSDGYFAVYDSKYSSDIKENAIFSYNSIMHVNIGEKIKLERCYAVPIDDAKVDTSGEGMFKIGTHLSSGNYHLKCTSSSREAYYSIFSDNEQNKIRDNDLFEGDAYISVNSGEYLVLERCEIVQ